MGDRKRDVLIATEVLGYEVFNPWDGGYFMASSVEAIDKARFYDNVCFFIEPQQDGKVEFCRELPHFESIVGAWQVIDRFSSGILDKDATEQFFGILDETYLHRLAAKEAAIVVCQVACKVMGIESEDETGRDVQGRLREMEIGV